MTGIEAGTSARSHFRWSLAASGLGLATLVIYITLIATQGGDQVWDIFPWVLLMVIPTAAALYAAQVSTPQTARVLLVAAFVVFVSLGVVSIFSVGLGFLGAAVFSAWALGRVPPR